MEQIRVVVVEDDVGWLKAMLTYLNDCDDIIVAGSALDKDQAMEIVSSIKPDVVLMDINLNGNQEEGIDATADILKIVKTKVIILTATMDEDLISQAFSAGAVNYVTKDNYKEIPNSIRSTFNNRSPIEYMLKEFRQLKKEARLVNLTSAERKLFSLLEKGYSRSQVMSELFITNNTVKKQIKGILVKLQASSIKEAISKINSSNSFL